MSGDVPDLTITGPAGRLTTRPGRGAKITSLVCPDASVGELEWLAPCRPSHRAGGGSAQPDPTELFTDAEMGGWDECAPSISAVVLPDGRSIADHGDLWRDPWQVLVHEPDRLSCRIEVTSLGFTLERTITATPLGFRLDYRADLLPGADPLPFLWVAHPQFIAPERLEVPALSRVREVYPRVGEQPVLWRDRPPVAGALKVWADDPVLPETVVLHRHASTLTMGWSGEPLRALALWFDASVMADGDVVSVEPATGLDDDVRVADAPMLNPGVPRRWSIDLSFAGTSSGTGAERRADTPAHGSCTN